VSLGVGESVPEIVAVTLTEGLGVAVAETETLAVAVADALALDAGLAVAELLVAAVGLAEAVGEPVSEVVTVGLTTPVAVGEERVVKEAVAAGKLVAAAGLVMLAE